MLLRDSTIVMSHSVTCCYVTSLLSCHTLLHVVMWLHYCHVTLCYMLLRDPIIVMSRSVTCCCVFLVVVSQSLKPVKLLSQQLPLFLLFRDHRSVVNARALHIYCLLGVLWVCILPTTYSRSQQCWELLRPFVRSLRCGVNLIKLLQV